MCELLLQLGAKPALGLQAETGALTFACGRDADSVATVKALVEDGVPPDRLIHAAARAGTVGTVHHLLKRGADPNLQDFMGHRPLREARSPAIIRELFRHGADPLAYGRFPGGRGRAACGAGFPAGRGRFPGWRQVGKFLGRFKASSCPTIEA